MNKLFTFLMFCMPLVVWTQIPTNLSTIEEDSPIQSVVVSDVSGNGEKDIIVMREGDDLMVHYNTSSGFFQDAYEEVINPTYLGIADLNVDGGPDIYYSAEGLDGLGFKYGISENPYQHNDRNFGEGDVMNITNSAVDNRGAQARFLAVYSPDGYIKTFYTTGGSFLILNAAVFHEIAVGDGGPMRWIDQDLENSTLYFLDRDKGEIISGAYSGSQFQPQAPEEMITVISGLGVPNDMEITVNAENKTLIYLSYPDQGKVVKYFFSEDSQEWMSEDLDNTLSNPTSMYLYDLDKDGFEDLFVVDGSTYYVYTDLRSDNDKEVVFEGQNEIQGVTFADINSDGLVDLFISEKESSVLSILTSEVVNIEDQNIVPFTTYPNPATSFLTIEKSYNPEVVSISDLKGNLTLVNPEKGRIDISLLAPGMYFLSFEMNHTVYRNRFIKK